MTSSTSFTLLK